MAFVGREQTYSIAFVRGGFIPWVLLGVLGNAEEQPLVANKSRLIQLFEPEDRECPK